MQKKLLAVLLIMISSSLVFWGCKRQADTVKTVISIKGSDTMVNLAQKWAETYMQDKNDVSIQVTGGGSGTGIAALLNGTTDISTASRDLKEIELKSASEKNITPNIFKVALDGIAVIVNPSNKVQTLTLAQLSDIFTAKITNWKEVGGADLPITLYGRENSSGTYEFFKEHVLGKDQNGRQKDYAVSTQVLQGTAALGEAVARDSKGIGYGGVGYFAERNDVKIPALKENNDSPAILPSVNGKVNYEAIWNRTYPVSRYLYCITNGEPKDAVKDFIDFIVSAEGQKLVETMEYIPLPKTKD